MSRDPGVKSTARFHLLTRLRKQYLYSSPVLTAFWLVKHRDNFTLTFLSRYRDGLRVPFPAEAIFCSPWSLIQWIPGAPSPGHETGHLPSPSAEVKNGGAIPPLPDMYSWHSLIKHGGNFTFHLFYRDKQLFSHAYFMNSNMSWRRLFLRFST
jgi:hypothetical protein